jgi:WD40 repeat protein
VTDAGNNRPGPDDSPENHLTTHPPEAGQTQYKLDVVRGEAVAVGTGAQAIVYKGWTAEQVADLIANLRQEDQPQVWDGRIPYLGLKPFQEADAQFFFGRKSLVDELLQRVQETNFIVISGPSGSGKSSVAQAGLLPALRTGRLEYSEQWLMTTLNPKGDPLEQLAQAIERLTKIPGTGNYLREHGPSNPLALHEQVQTLLDHDQRQRCFLLVDQFEETFTQTKEPALQAAFIDLLTSGVQVENSRLTVVLSMRSDFVSHCARFPELRALMSRHFQLVGAMEPRDLAQAITLPALAVGAEIDPELVATIINDMKGEPGALPLMSFALRDLFMAEKTEKGQPMDLTLPEYLQRGGIESALERHANQVFRDFSVEQQALAKSIFSRLIEVGQGRVDTRRTATFTELVPAGASADLVAATIARLAEENVRLITTSGSNNGASAIEATTPLSTVTIAHEKLIDAWPWLRRLVDENRDLIALQNQINQDAQEWKKQEDTGYLYRGGRLLQVEEQIDVLRPGLNTLSQQFIQASLDQRRQEIAAEEARRQRELEQERALAEEQRQRAEEAEKAAVDLRRRRNVAFGLAGGALLLMVLAIFFFIQAQRNEEDAIAQAAEAEEARAEVAARGTVAAQNLERALTSEALEATRAAEAEAALLTAERERQIAESRSLAVQSSRYYDDQYDLALLLSVAARNSADTLEAQSSQLNALTYNPHLVSYFHEHDGPVTSIAFSADGELLASGDSTGRLVIRRLADGSVVHDIDTGHSASILRLQFNPDSSSLVSASFSEYNQSLGAVPPEVKIWDIASGENLLDAGTDSGYDFKHVAISPDAQLAAFLTENYRIVVWDLETDRQIGLSGDLGRVSHLTFLEASDTLLWQGYEIANSVVGDDVIGLWDIAQAQVITRTTFSGHSNSIEAITTSPDGRFLASTSYDGTTLLNQVPDGAAAGRFGTSFSTWTFTIEERGSAFSPDSQRLALGGVGEILVYDQTAESGWQQQHRLTGHSGNILSLSFSSSPGLLASGGEDGSVVLWMLDESRLQQTEPEWQSSIFTPQGDRFAVLGDSEVTFYASESRQPLNTIPLTMTASRLWSISADAQTLVMSNYPGGNQTFLVDADTGNQLGTPLTNSSCNRLAYPKLSPDDRFLALACGRSGTFPIALYDISTGQQLPPLDNDRFLGVAFSPDSVILAAGTLDGQIYLWRTGTWEMIGEPLSGHNGWVLSLDFHPDGQMLASAGQDRIVRLWNRDADGQWTAGPRLQGHTDWIRDIAFSPDGSLLASSGDEDTVLLWDVASGRQLGRLSSDDSEVMFNPDVDNLLLATGNAIWDLNADDWSEMACQVANRNLSPAEWALFFGADRDYISTCP